tara:strand:- start:398 stop:727 length:330 start_codon:yes stop_codon:yes gene_type:complete
MLKVEVILAENDVIRISEGLKEINVGGLTIIKVRGRGAKTAPEIHAHKGLELFIPQFSDKYRLMVVIPESKEEKTVEIIKKNSRSGKIFISQMLRAIDIETDDEGEEII